MVDPRNCRSAVRFFLKKTLHNKKDQEVHENFFSCFLIEKKSHLKQINLFRLFFTV